MDEELIWLHSEHFGFADLRDKNRDERVANVFWLHGRKIYYTIQSCGFVRVEYPGLNFQEAMKFVEAQYILTRDE